MSFFMVPPGSLSLSLSGQAAVQDIKFFFPDMGVDPLPDDHEVKDFLFRPSGPNGQDAGRGVTLDVCILFPLVAQRGGHPESL